MNKNVRFFLIFLLVFIITGCGRKDAKDTIELLVKGESMEDFLFEGEKVLIDKETTVISRYDIIVFVPDGKATKFRDASRQEYYIKRVYGLPGDTIQIKGNDIFINGENFQDGYAKNMMDDSGIAKRPLKLANDEYFVLGDNREVSLDSRDSDLGPIKKEQIIGQLIARWDEQESEWVDLVETKE